MQADERTDADLLNGLVNGDESSLSALYDRFASRVNAVAVAVVGEGMLADEVVQDVFVKLWTNPGAYTDMGGKFAAWLLTVTRRAALDRLRREHVRAGVTLGDSASLDDDDSLIQLPDLRMQEESRWRDWQMVIDQLPRDQRDCLTLAFYRGMSQSEISEHLGAPLGTIKSRIKVGMEKLRAMLEATR